MNLVTKDARKAARLLVRNGGKHLAALKTAGNRSYRHKAGLLTRMVASGRADAETADFTPRLVTGWDVCLGEKDTKSLPPSGRLSLVHPTTAGRVFSAGAQCLHEHPRTMTSMS